MPTKHPTIAALLHSEEIGWLTRIASGSITIARDRRDALHPAGTMGQTQYSEAIRLLRQALAVLDWRETNCRGFLTFGPKDGRYEIAVGSGTIGSNTGPLIFDGIRPEGYRSVAIADTGSAMKARRQGTLFEAGEPGPTRTVLFLVLGQDATQARAELQIGEGLVGGTMQCTECLALVQSLPRHEFAPIEPQPVRTDLDVEWLAIELTSASPS